MAVDLWLGVLRSAGEEEVGVEAHGDLPRRDPAAVGKQRLRVGQRDAGLLGDLAHAGDPVARVVLTVLGVDGTARERPMPRP